ncbi:hypothetical protein [Lichenibacterium dinghuense]|uniref:hypothetical protein n=1 Tax=Lichenibacterium dinghuense TaxID=2895977 RepID=UPI001F23CFF8|nr:hypothetical protein [Lichenibacterium sp. 6Y81]
MPGMERYFVTESFPRPRNCLFQGRSIAACLDWIRSRGDGPERRCVVWNDHPPAGGDPDAFVCLPAWFLDAWRDHAAEVVESWDSRWLLIESAPGHHRAEAKADLLEAIATALTTASQSTLPEDEVDVGF